MKDRLELFEEVYKAQEQIASGEGICHKDAKARILARLGL